MMITPLVPWWIIVIFIGLLLGFVLWQLWIQRKHRLRVWSWIRRGCMVLLLAILLLRPTLPGGQGEVGLANADVYFVIDTTVSMSAEDYNGEQQRLAGVRGDVAALTERLAGAKFSVITFDNDSYTELPLTSDATAVRSLIDALRPQLTIYARGSSISQPLNLLQKELSRTSQADPTRKKLVYYFGDGEQTADGTPASFSPVAPLIDGGGVLGYGTSDGGRMKEYLGYTDDSQTASYVRDYSDIANYNIVDARSRIDEANLRTIANQLGVGYLHQTSPGAVDGIVAAIDTDRLTGEPTDVDLREDMYWIVAVGLVGLLAWEIWSLRLTLRDGSERRHL
ncbi:MAG: VWA domain-containing protein [Candidatus Saccharimonas sp.]